MFVGTRQEENYIKNAIWRARKLKLFNGNRGAGKISKSLLVGQKLFNGYKDAGKIPEALLVGQNLFNRYPANPEVFAAYFDFLCSLADLMPSLDERQDFANRATVALAFFAENAELDDKLVADITTYQQRLTVVDESINKDAIKESEQHNDACFKELITYKENLQSADTQEQFDAVLLEIGAIDSRFNKDSLTAEQSAEYDTLTKGLTNLISVKMRELEYKKNITYNKQAADSFHEAFKEFRDDENAYKNRTKLYALVSSTLFAYDASRLFNETMIYYNHIYSFIFSKLDEDGKFALTRYSIECERKLR